MSLYNGKLKWTAALQLSELFTDMPIGIKRYQPQFQYFLLDEGKTATDSSAWPNLVASLIDFEQSQTLDQIFEILGRSLDWLNQDTRGHSHLRRILLSWVGRNIIQARFPGADLPELSELSDTEVKNMLAERAREWPREWEQQGIEKGLEQGSYLTKIDNARKMLLEGFSAEVIQRITDLSLEEIENLNPDTN